MPVPSPRNSIRIARGNIADLNTNSTAFGEGEILYAIDQDRFYTSVSGSLVPVGAGVLNTESIDALADVDTTTVPPGVGQVLKWDGTNWTPANDANTDAVTSVAGKTGAVTLVKADVGLEDVDNTSDLNKPISTATQTALNAKAPLASPALTGSPTAPTATAGTNTTQLATTAFVGAAITAAAVPSASETVQGKVELATAAETTAGTDDTRAVHPAGLKVELDKKAPLTSPALTGTPTAPTATSGTSTTQIATTAFVGNAVAGITYPVQSVAGKTGAVTLAKADITNFSDADYATAAQGTLAVSALQPSSIGTTVQAYDADTTKNDTTNSFTALQTFTAGIDNNGAGYRSGITAMGALDINCSLGNYFTKTISGNSTFTVSNVPSSRAYAFTLELTHTSGTVTWFSGVQWPGGTTPTLTTGRVHLFTFITDDGGTSWRGSSQINYAS